MSEKKMATKYEIIERKKIEYQNQLDRIEEELNDYRIIMEYKKKTCDFIRKKLEELKK